MLACPRLRDAVLGDDAIDGQSIREHVYHCEEYGCCCDDESDNATKLSLVILLALKIETQGASKKIEFSEKFILSYSLFHFFEESGNIAEIFGFYLIQVLFGRIKVF